MDIYRVGEAAQQMFPWIAALAIVLLAARSIRYLIERNCEPGIRVAIDGNLDSNSVSVTNYGPCSVGHVYLEISQGRAPTQAIFSDSLVFAQNWRAIGRGKVLRCTAPTLLPEFLRHTMVKDQQTLLVICKFVRQADGRPYTLSSQISLEEVTGDLHRFVQTNQRIAGGVPLASSIPSVL